jgi:hypothetical protein
MFVGYRALGFVCLKCMGCVDILWVDIRTPCAARAADSLHPREQKERSLGTPAFGNDNKKGNSKSKAYDCWVRRRES